MFDTIKQVAEEVLICTKCQLSTQRTKAVPGEGNEKARIMLIGEGPGAQEDRQGRPFVGAAGDLLNRTLKEVGIAREEVFITNIVKCRPPENRPPKPDEINSCNSYVMRQIKLIVPDIVCLLGRVAFETIAGSGSITKARGIFFEKDGQLYLPTYHPAAILRNATLMVLFKQDLQALQKRIENIGQPSARTMTLDESF
ncbi:MAG: uracil-DNA glycosylase [Thaumarchaeota archaeon]|nr:uracil-DNA glycosylase [Nitrososphaerota archaeon]